MTNRSRSKAATYSRSINSLCAFISATNGPRCIPSIMLLSATKRSSHIAHLSVMASSAFGHSRLFAVKQSFRQRRHHSRCVRWGSMPTLRALCPRVSQASGRSVARPTPTSCTWSRCRCRVPERFDTKRTRPAHISMPTGTSICGPLPQSSSQHPSIVHCVLPARARSHVLAPSASFMVRNPSRISAVAIGPRVRSRHG